MNLFLLHISKNECTHVMKRIEYINNYTDAVLKHPLKIYLSDYAVSKETLRRAFITDFKTGRFRVDDNPVGTPSSLALVHHRP